MNPLRLRRRTSAASANRIVRRTANAASAVLLAGLGVTTLMHADERAVLPDYRPVDRVSGVIRSWGNNEMGPLMRRWEAGFHRYQPDVYFDDTLKGTASAQFGLDTNMADLALMGRQVFTYETYGIYRRSHMLPVGIAVAAGSFDVPHKSYALTVFVHRDNPLRRLTVAQLDEIFGAQRTGGWQGLRWNRAVARSSEQNIRTWGKLGLTGAWADKPLHVYGPPGIYPGGTSFFQIRVMGGADTWNPALQEFADPRKMMAALSADPEGIAYTGMRYRTPEVKALAIANKPAGPFVLPTRETVADHSYPLSRLVYIYFTPDQANGDPADPKVLAKLKEFLRYILSRQGQEDVAAAGDYLPLTPRLVQAQLKKLQ